MPLVECNLLNIKRSILWTLVMTTVSVIVAFAIFYILNGYAIGGVWIAMILLASFLLCLVVMRYIADSYGHRMFTRYNSEMKKAKKNQSENAHF